MQDIETSQDIKYLVDDFYEKALKDDQIGIFFTEIAEINLEKHLPIMYAFWESILLKNHAYRRNAFLPHMDLHRKKKMTREHFERWTYLFNNTVDEHFTGANAETVKERATQIAQMMHHKITQVDAIECNATK